MLHKDTNKTYYHIVESCKDLFLKKTADYGTSWRVLRPIAVIDQIYIKLQRIKTIQEQKQQKIKDSIHEELIGIVNYSIIGLMQLELANEISEDINVEQVKEMYTQQVEKAYKLMQLKNHDYGEAWRNLSEISSIDLMLMKIHRMKQILTNKGKTLVSEGIEANYLDIINYAIFMQILFYEK